MDLKQLMTMREEIGSLSFKRHRESDVSFLNGMDLLEKAQASDFKDKGLLLRASDCFMEAIQNNRRNPDPYVGVAYLFLLLRQQAKALRYLNEARRVAPSHEKARLLLESIVEQQEIEKEQPEILSVEVPGEERTFADQNLPVLGADRDFDSLYDAIEALLMAESRKLMDEPFNAVPTLDPVSLLPVGERLQVLAKVYLHIEKQIQILDQEIDTSDLRARLHPLEVMKRRMEQVLQVSEQFQSLQEQSQQAQKQTNSLFREILSAQDKAQLQGLESQLEQLLDECDRIADILDSISEKGFSIESVEEYYNQLTGAVETCQDLLDERMETL